MTEVAEPLVEQVNAAAKTANKKIKRRFFKSKRRVVRYGLVIVNVALFFGISSFIIANRPGSSSTPASTLLSTTISDELTDPLDQVSSVDIAFNISLITGIPEASTLVHEIDAESVKDDVVISGSQTISKPQIVKTDLKSKNDIQQYVVVEGDTVQEVARKFNVSSNSIRWSNDLSGGSLSVGSTLNIPPVDGIVYTVKAGDTPATLASEYRSSESRIVAFNDAEINGLVEGESIVIPDGEVVPVFTNTVTNGTPSNFTAVYGGNRYSPGNCTWHTANRWAAVGKQLPGNLGNASTWVSRARAAGLATGNTPQQYAAVQTSTGGWGHVGFVEEVYPDGSMLMSEMNYNWVLYSQRTRVVTAAEAARYSYIY